MAGHRSPISRRMDYVAPSLLASSQCSPGVKHLKPRVRFHSIDEEIALSASPLYDETYELAGHDSNAHWHAGYSNERLDPHQIPDAPRLRTVPLPPEDKISHPGRVICVRIQDPGLKEWCDILSSMESHLEEAPGGLRVVWRQSSQDPYSYMGLGELRSLFLHLNQDTSARRSLRTLVRVSIEVPSRLAEACHPQESAIDLLDALMLEEFCWKGDVNILAQSFTRIPFSQLSILKITNCVLSIDTALAILQACPSVMRVALETLDDGSMCPEGQILKANHTSTPYLQHLQWLSLTSNTALDGLFRRLSWEEHAHVTLVLSSRGISKLTKSLLELEGNEVSRADVYYPKGSIPDNQYLYTHFPLSLHPL